MSGEYGRHRCGDNCGFPYALSFDAEWERRESPPTAAWCYAQRWRGASKLTGAIQSGNPKPCGGWGHRDCAEKKTHRLLTHLSRKTDNYRKVWVAVADHDEKLMNRVAQRRLAAKVGGSFWVRRENGLVVFVFDRPLRKGITSPKVTYAKTPEEMLELIANVGLRLPGVTTARFGGSWEVSKPDGYDDGGESDEVSLGFLADKTFALAFETAAAEARRKWGVEIGDPEEPVPEGIPLAEWFKLLGRGMRVVS